ncbi:MAG: hypothetical protein CL609_24315 [Anaerolineaceae bacterium]|jgi:hypothetical protein|nr:hypothetical protein [Anaerolineaceae bacterium]
MNRFLKWILAGVFLLLLASYLVFVLVNHNAVMKVDPTSIKVEVSEDVNQKNQEIENKLRHAPWQGLRFIREERTWRFYGVAGETKQIDLIQPISLVKVYYLEADGDLSFTWAATEIQFGGKPTYSLTSHAIREGQVIGVQLKGDYVAQNGVYWEDCESDYCHLAQMIDTMIVLDDQGTGLSNGFIRYGWEPPTYPAYGFLCWQIISEEESQELSLLIHQR